MRLWGGIFDIEQRREFVNSETLKTQESGFWNNPEDAEKILKNITAEKKWIIEFDKLFSKYEEVELVYEFFKSNEISEEEADKEFESLNTIIEDLELKNMLRNEEDSDRKSVV